MHTLQEGDTRRKKNDDEEEIIEDKKENASPQIIFNKNYEPHHKRIKRERGSVIPPHLLAQYPSYPLSFLASPSSSPSSSSPSPVSPSPSPSASSPSLVSFSLPSSTTSTSTTTTTTTSSSIPSTSSISPSSPTKIRLQEAQHTMSTSPSPPPSPSPSPSHSPSSPTAPPSSPNLPPPQISREYSNSPPPASPPRTLHNSHPLSLFHQHQPFLSQSQTTSNSPAKPNTKSNYPNYSNPHSNYYSNTHSLSHSNPHSNFHPNYPQSPSKPQLTYSSHSLSSPRDSRLRMDPTFTPESHCHITDLVVSFFESDLDVNGNFREEEAKAHTIRTRTFQLFATRCWATCVRMDAVYTPMRTQAVLDILQTLRHPNLATPAAHFPRGRFYYAVYPRYTSVDCNSDDLTRRDVEQLRAGLQMLHRVGLRHGDVGIESVMRDEDGTPLWAFCERALIDHELNVSQDLRKFDKIIALCSAKEEYERERKMNMDYNNMEHREWQKAESEKWRIVDESEKRGRH